MKFRLAIVTSLAITAAFGFGILASRGWPAGPRLYAWVVAIPGFVLMGITFIKEALAARKPGVASPVEAKAGPRKEIAFFGGIAAFVAAAWLFGFVLSAALFVFAYLKVKGVGWLLSGALAAAVAVLLNWGLFGQAFETPRIEGMVPRWLGL
ncbi:MAG: hypothetical protein HY673_07070 [Chloroflexi bacterium]|nr:hypothetical protein [Chloroflexota bacterium]